MTEPYAYYSNKTRGFYITEIEYESYPEDSLPITQEEHEYLLKELNGNNKIIIVTDGVISLTERTIPVPTWDEIRLRRNGKLTNSDHTQLPDFPAAKKTEWATYRQALRDIPQTYATPEEVIWPIEPT